VHLAGDGGPDGRRDLAGVGVLEQVTGGTRLQGGAHPLLLDERGHRDHLDVGPAPLDLGGGGHAVHHGHLQVHEDDVGQPARAVEDGQLVERPLAVVGLADHGHPRLGRQVGRQPGAHHLVVVDEEDPSLVRRRIRCLCHALTRPRPVVASPRMMPQRSRRAAQPRDRARSISAPTTGDSHRA
jgi:hypothetical protein